MKRTMKRNTKRNNMVTRKEIVIAQAAQYRKLSNYALRNGNYFIAEYYENLSKEVMKGDDVR